MSSRDEAEGYDELQAAGNGPRRRISIRDRAHAREIARQLAFGDLLKGGGSATGFADWLFVRRKTFNGQSPLQQARVYANRNRHASKHGYDLDALYRQRADEKEHAEQKALSGLEANRIAMKEYWSEPPLGMEITLAVLELCLGRGHRFAVSPEGKALTELPQAWVLEYLLELLDKFGGPDESLEAYDGSRESWEFSLQRYVARSGGALMNIRQQVLRGLSLSELDFVCIASAARLLSSLSRVRTFVRTLLTQARMTEQIKAAAITPHNGRAHGPERRRRGHV